MTATVRQVQVTFDCAEPERVARFWCEVLGYVVPPPPPGFDSWDAFDRSLPLEHQGSAFACVDPTGAGPRLFFQRVPEGKVGSGLGTQIVRTLIQGELGGTIDWHTLTGSGTEVTIDTVSHEGVLPDQGSDPVAFFGRHGV
ncbi:hypothetical protein IAE22_28195, partial [Bacillus sp. S34]|nr:hypothetical protein [Bacillus sp. S34]